MKIWQAATSDMAMIIPTPREMESELSPLVQRHAELLATRLRGTKRYGGRYIIDKHGVPCDLQKAVAAEFEARGWAVKWHDDQRDGTSVEFTAAASGNSWSAT